MGFIAVIAAVFLALLFLPFVVSLLSIRKSREASLYVKSDNVRDPRYFSSSFRTLVDKGIDRNSRTIKMSKLETFIYAEELTGNSCNSIVVAEHHFQPVGMSTFHKEIIAESTADIPPKTSIRAIACLNALELGENCEVVRWADSDKQMTVLDGCALGMSATSGERIVIGPGCTFRRLYAPEIVIGSRAAATVRFPVDSTFSNERWINPEEVKPHESVRKTIVTEYSLEVGEGAVIMGSIKSARHIYLHKGVRVNGNVVADGAIIMDEGVRVLGNVFSQDSILVGPAAEVGMKPKIKSLIARKSVTLCETAKVFGYIGCEMDGQTIAQQDFKAELNKKHWASKMEMLRAESAEERTDDARADTQPGAVEAIPQRAAAAGSMAGATFKTTPAAQSTARVVKKESQPIDMDAEDEEEESLFD